MAWIRKFHILSIVLLLLQIPTFPVDAAAPDKPLIRFGVIPRYLLWDNGIGLRDLKSYVNHQHHDAVAKAILKGQFDAGAVKDVVAEKYKPHGLRILAWSAPIPAVPLVVRNDTPPAL